MTRTRLLRTSTLLFTFCLAAAAQDRGYWRASSKTARDITGDLALSETKLAINFTNYTIAQIRDLTAEEVAAVFSESTPGGKGNLYRLDIPGTKQMMHHNTLCGGEDTEWLLTYVHGKQMQAAFFSGPSIPAMTGEAMANATNLCGTFSYTR